jgi:FkbM family methyltransferase
MPLKTAPCKHGVFTVFDNDFWIGQALLRTGEYSEQEVIKLLSLVDADSVVIEVGANIGAISVPLAKKVHELICFEPQPAIFDVLVQNLRRNAPPSCHCSWWQMAVGAKSEKRVALAPIDVDAPGVNLGAAYVAKFMDGDNAERVTAQTTIDEFCNENVERLDLIKMDVEGMECDVLDGAAKTIARLRPLLWVENDREQHSQALIGKIMGMGYRLWWCPTPLFNPDPNNIAPFFSFNMLCAPQEREIVVGDDLMPITSTRHDWRLAGQWAGQRYQINHGVRPKLNKGWACVVRLGAVGDNLIASSVLPYLREQHGKMEVICADPYHVIFENNPHIDKLTVKKQGTPGGDGMAFQNYWLDRADDYEFFVHLSHTCEGLRAIAASQTAFYWPAEARRKLFGQSYLETVGDIAGVPYDRLAPDFYPTESEIENAQEIKRSIGGRYIAWVLSGSRWDKLWPHTMVAIARIIKEFRWPVIMTGVPGKDHELAVLIVEHVRKANGEIDGLHLAMSTDAANPAWPIRRVLTQVQQADVVVTPDTGPAWAVAMHDMPKIVMLGHAGLDSITKHWRNTITLHADPAEVPCWPCHLLHDSKESCQRVSGSTDGVGAQCISNIGVESLMGAIRAVTMRESPVPMMVRSTLSGQLLPFAAE